MSTNNSNFTDFSAFGKRDTNKTYTVDSGISSMISSIGAIWFNEDADQWKANIITETGGKKKRDWVKIDNLEFIERIQNAVADGGLVFRNAAGVQDDTMGVITKGDDDNSYTYEGVNINLSDGLKINGREMSPKCRFYVQTTFALEYSEEYDLKTTTEGALIPCAVYGCNQLDNLVFQKEGVPFVLDIEDNVPCFMFTRTSVLTSDRMKDVKTYNVAGLVAQLLAEYGEDAFSFEATSFVNPEQAQEYLVEEFKVMSISMEAKIEAKDFFNYHTGNTNALDSTMAKDGNLEVLDLKGVEAKDITVDLLKAYKGNEDKITNIPTKGLAKKAYKKAMKTVNA